MYMTDTRGKRSITLTYISVALAIVTIRFAIGGLTFGSFGQVPVMGVAEFGVAFLAIIAPWMQREWTEKTKVPPGPQQ